MFNGHFQIVWIQSSEEEREIVEIKFTTKVLGLHIDRWVYLPTCLLVRVLVVAHMTVGIGPPVSTLKLVALNLLQTTTLGDVALWTNGGSYWWSIRWERGWLNGRAFLSNCICSLQVALLPLVNCEKWSLRMWPLSFHTITLKSNSRRVTIHLEICPIPCVFLTKCNRA